MERKDFGSVEEALKYLLVTDSNEIKYADDCFVKEENLCDILDRMIRKEVK